MFVAFYCLRLPSTAFIAILMGLAAPGVAQASSSTVIATYVVHADRRSIGGV